MIHHNENKSIRLVIIIGVRDHFRWGGGGAQHFVPEFRILARKSNVFGQCIFCRTWGGGCLEENTTLLK